MVSSSYLPGILLWPLAGAVVTALGPGTAVTGTPASWAAVTSR